MSPRHDGIMMHECKDIMTCLICYDDGCSDDDLVIPCSHDQAKQRCSSPATCERDDGAMMRSGAGWSAAAHGGDAPVVAPTPPPATGTLLPYLPTTMLCQPRYAALQCAYATPIASCATCACETNSSQCAIATLQVSYARKLCWVPTPAMCGFRH